MDEERTTVRRLRWVGDSREKLQEFPKQVRKNMGHALYLVQTGQTPPHAKPLRGIGSGVFEIVDDYDTNTYRAVYAVKVGESLYFLFQLFLLIKLFFLKEKFGYVLHAFQKKSKRGIKTPQKEIELIKRRLRRAQEMAQEEEATHE